MNIYCVLLSSVCLVGAIPQFHRVEKYTRKEPVAQDVIVDEEGKYIMVFSPYSGSKIRPSVNFHDMASGYTAVKDIKKGVCYLDINNHTIEEFKERILTIQKQSVNDGVQLYSWNCDKTPMPSELVYKVAGDKIGAFCDEYDTILVDRLSKEYVRTNKRSSDQEESDDWCIYLYIYLFIYYIVLLLITIVFEWDHIYYAQNHLQKLYPESKGKPLELS